MRVRPPAGWGGRRRCGARSPRLARRGRAATAARPRGVAQAAARARMQQLGTVEGCRLGALGAGRGRGLWARSRRGGLWKRGVSLGPRGGHKVCAEAPVQPWPPVSGRRGPERRGRCGRETDWRANPRPGPAGAKRARARGNGAARGAGARRRRGGLPSPFHGASTSALVPPTPKRVPRHAAAAGGRGGCAKPARPRWALQAAARRRGAARRAAHGATECDAGAVREQPFVRLRAFVDTLRVVGRALGGVRRIHRISSETRALPPTPNQAYS